MSLERPDFDNLAEADLAELLAIKVPESIRLDYKRDMYGSTDSEKREALKDISSFANTAGGHLVIGVTEAAGVPSAIDGVTCDDPDAVLTRINQLAINGLEPRIEGLRVRSVPLGNGNHCFVVRVPRSWNSPHRVISQNSNRFWVRNTSGAHEANVSELRTLFTLGADAATQARRFRDQRIESIISGQGSRPLVGEGRLILHLIPLAGVAGSLQIDVGDASRNQDRFRPIGSLGFSPRYNIDGFINEWAGEANYGYTQIFRNGSLEATKASIVKMPQGLRTIAASPFQRDLLSALPELITGLRDIGVPMPIMVFVTLHGVKGVIYKIRANPDEPEPQIDSDLIRLPDCIIHGYGTADDYKAAVKPAFDALWNAAGEPYARSFLPNGKWTTF